MSGFFEVHSYFKSSDGDFNDEEVQQDPEWYKSITGEPSQIDKFGIRFVTAQNSDYWDVLEGTNPNSDVLRFVINSPIIAKRTAIVKNESDKDIIGVQVLLSSTYGDPINSVDEISFGFLAVNKLTNDGSIVSCGDEEILPLRPGEARLLATNSFDRNSRKPFLTDHDIAQIKNDQKIFRLQESWGGNVKFELDGVFFEGGGFYGSNKSFIFEAELARLEAERDFVVKMREYAGKQNADYSALDEEMAAAADERYMHYGINHPDAATAYQSHYRFILQRRADQYTYARRSLPAANVAKELSKSESVEKIIYPYRIDQ